jgi:Tol biopolymer transport system component
MISILDSLQQARTRRLTLEGRNLAPIWSPDGQYVVFQSDREGDRGLFRQRANGSLPAERLTRAESGTRHLAGSWSPDGKVLAFVSFNSRNVPSIWTVSLDDGKPRPFTDPKAPLPAMSPAFSPDGRWIAYTEILRELGPPNLFVRPYPVTATKYQLTTRVGNLPVWSHDGKQLLYEVGVSGPTQGNLLLADFRTTSGTSLGEPTVVRVPPRPRNIGSNDRFFDLSPDGKRVIVVATAEDNPNQPSPSTEINVVLNWTEELKARVPTK